MKPQSIDELLTAIYEDNLQHVDFIEAMNSGDCDCSIHATFKMIESYL
jgi:hypothetical protein